MGKKSLVVLAAASLCVISVFLYESVSFAHPLDERPLLKPIKKGGAPITLEPVADGLTAPNWGTFAPGDTERLFVTDQAGTLWAIDLATGDKTVFLDVSPSGLNRIVDPLGAFGPNSFDERGLLGVAFHPDYTANGLLYTYTSEPVNGPADFSTMPPGTTANHQSMIIEWQVPNPTDPASVVDPGSARGLLRIDQPQFNHNAGALNFGPDGMLYISVGDGGAADDVDSALGGQPDFLGAPVVGHGTGNAQDPTNPLGKILRIDVGGSNSANGQYGIPADNPFVGEPGFIDEIFAFGFRNPFRFSFDKERGDLYLADVGQNDVEEVDVVVAGGNYGWNLKEGSFFFTPNDTARCADPDFSCSNGTGTATDEDPGGLPPDLIDSIAEYDTHDEGHAVIGGFVYRGNRIKGLRGRYVFGDYTILFNPAEGVFEDGRLFFLNKKNVVKKNKTKKSKIVEFRLVGQEGLGLKVLGFGQDASGELYLLGNDTGTPFGDTGVVLRIAPGDDDNDG